MSLQISYVNKQFQLGDHAVSALNSASLEIKKGEFVVLVGPSGCGKSTLLRMVAGLESPDSGKLSLSRNEISGPGRERALVFQDGALFPWLTVVQNIEFALRETKDKFTRRQQARGYLEAVGLLDKENRCIHELSGGQRQRVAIARALALEPEVLLMDEPFSALDAMTREDLYWVVQQLWERTGCSVLLVTHNVREAVTLGDRVIAMRPTKGEYESSIAFTRDIKLPRPRSIEDIGVATIAREIGFDLRAAQGDQK